MLINSVKKKILKITPDHGVYKSPNPPKSQIEKAATRKFTSFNNQTGAQYTSYSFNNTEGTQTDQPVGPVNLKKEDEDPNDLEILTLVPPKDLDGYNILWKIATESTSKAVIDSAARLLI